MLDRILDKGLKDEIGNLDFRDLRIDVDFDLEILAEPRRLDAEIGVDAVDFLSQRHVGRGIGIERAAQEFAQPIDHLLRILLPVEQSSGWRSS